MVITKTWSCDSICTRSIRSLLPPQKGTLYATECIGDEDTIDVKNLQF